MSAFFLDKTHIDALVTYAQTHAVAPFDADALGKILWDENRKSVSHHYGDAADIWELDAVEKYRFQAAYLNTAAIVKACHCYAYQSCEHPGWAASTSKRVVDVIERRALRALKTTYERLQHRPAYAEAPWEVHENDVYRETRPNPLAA